MKKEGKTTQFVVCIKNEGCDDLELRKVYQTLPDEEAAKDDYIRVIDESGEDYLYPQDCFAHVELSRAAEEALRTAA